MAQISIQYTADIAQLNAKLDQIIQKQEEIIVTAKNAGDEMTKATKKASDETTKFKSNLDGLKEAIIGAFAIDRIVAFTKSMVETERKLELLQNRLNFVAGSSEKGAELFQRLVVESRKLGINVEALAEGMASFGISATQAGFSAQKAEQMFVKISAGLRAAGSSSLQSQRAFFAMQQMIDKGVVSAEELRRQLAEALPGATSLMVRAYNNLHPKQQVTMEQFIKLQEEGKILSREVLPEFANVIEQEFAPALAGKEGSLDAAIERVTTNFTLLKASITNTAFIKFFVDQLSENLQRVNAIINSESVPAFERLSRVMLEYMGLGSLNNDVVQKQIASEKLAAASSKAANEKAMNDAKELMKLTKEERDLKVKQYEADIKAADALIVNSDQKLIKYKEELAALKENMQEQLKFNKANTKSIRDEAQGQLKIEAEYLSKESELKKFYRIEERNFDLADARNKKKYAETLLSELTIMEKAAYEESVKASREAADKQRKDREQELKDAVALAKIRVEQAEKRSIEENDARAILAQKQKELDEFMAKSPAEAQLARVIGEKKANEQILESRTKLADALSQEVLEDEIIPSEDPALKRIDKELETMQKNASKITQAIAKPYLDAQALEIADTTLKYQELINLTKENSEERKMLEEALQKELDNIRQKYADKDEARENKKLEKITRSVQLVVNQFGDAFVNILGQDIERNNQELKNLEDRFDRGLIAQEQYEEQRRQIQRRVFEDEKSMQIARAVMSGANAILSILSNPTLLPLAPILIPITSALTLGQIGIIQSQTPGFKEGVIDLQGPGTETSDSIVARLSRGESVMTAKETRKYKDVLEAIREDRLPSLIAEKYLIPAYKDSFNEKKSVDLGKTSMELAFQTAELVQAVKSNKVINLSDKSVNRLASAMNKTSVMEKKIRRRGL